MEYDDLVGYGTFGLIDAIDKFDIDKGVKFETYASLRIRGAIIDSVRNMDWIPRSLRQKSKELEKLCALFGIIFYLMLVTLAIEHFQEPGSRYFPVG